MKITVEGSAGTSDPVEAIAFDIQGSNADLLQIILPNQDLIFARFEAFQVEFTPEELEEMKEADAKRRAEEARYRTANTLLT